MIRDNRKPSVKPLESRTDKIYPITDNDPEITNKKIENGEIKKLPRFNKFKKLVEKI